MAFIALNRTLVSLKSLEQRIEWGHTAKSPAMIELSIAEFSSLKLLLGRKVGVEGSFRITLLQGVGPSRQNKREATEHLPNASDRMPQYCIIPK